MSKTADEIRLFLCTCSGEDGFIVKKCIKPIQIRFASIGFFVLLIFFACFWSATLFTYNLFEGARWISVPMGIIWGLIVANIYLLLLHTISPKLLPVSNKRNRNQTDAFDSKFFNSSTGFRLGFMLLLAIIIAQPFNYLFLKDSAETSIRRHKNLLKVKMYYAANEHNIKDELELYQNFGHQTRYNLNSIDSAAIANRFTSKISQDSNFISTVRLIFKDLHQLNSKRIHNKKDKATKEILIASLSTILDNQLLSDTNFITSEKTISITNRDFQPKFDAFKKILLNKINERNSNFDNFNQLIENNDFYIKTIQIVLHNNPISWLITLFFCMVFLLPIYMKFKVRDLSKSFFEKDYKDNSDMKRVREEILNHKDFKWLEKKIKSINLNDLRTSDYYFKRMLIEHKIILEEYDQTKKKFSKSLTANVKQYNRSSLKRILPLLEKLKQVNPNKYNEIKKQIFEEYVDEEMVKYEYWLDCPFRTKRVNSPDISNNESEFLDFIYNLEA